MVIYGMVDGDRVSKCSVGGARFVVPIIQDVAFIPLCPIATEVHLSEVNQHDEETVEVHAGVTLAVGTDEELMENAAERLLGMTEQQMAQTAYGIIAGEVRYVLVSHSTEEMTHDRDGFVAACLDRISPPLAAVGLLVVSIDIRSLTARGR